MATWAHTAPGTTDGPRGADRLACGFRHQARLQGQDPHASQATRLHLWRTAARSRRGGMGREADAGQSGRGGRVTFSSCSRSGANSQRDGQGRFLPVILILRLRSSFGQFESIKKVSGQKPQHGCDSVR